MIRMVFPAADWAYACIAMDMSPRKTAVNTDVQKQTVRRAVSVERSNKREKQDYKLEDGRHRSTKMWYCRLYGIMMLQHLDAWEMPSVEDLRNAIQAA